MFGCLFCEMNFSDFPSECFIELVTRLKNNSKTSERSLKLGTNLSPIFKGKVTFIRPQSGYNILKVKIDEKNNDP